MKKFLNIALFAFLTATSFNHQAVAASKKSGKFPETKIVSLNYHEGLTEITPGLNFPIDLSLQSSEDFPESGRYLVPVSFYLVESSRLEDITEKNIAASSIYLGKAFVRSPKKGSNQYNLDIPSQEALVGHTGTYALVAWLDPAGEKSGKKKTKLYLSGLNVTVSEDHYNQPELSIVKIDLDQQAILASDSEDKILGGTLTVQSRFTSTNTVRVSACLVLHDASCQNLPIWNSEIQNYDSYFKLSNLERNDQLTTLFQLKLPPQGDEGFNKIRIKLEDESGNALNTQADADLHVFRGQTASFYDDSDFAQDVRSKMAEASKTIKRLRLKGKIPNPLFSLKKTKDGKIDLAKSLDGIVSAKNLVVAKAIGKTTNADSYSLPDGLVSQIPGSRFNMPDQDFPWLKDIGVKADPPPEQYNGKGFPNIAEYRRCIPFFCGPNSPDEAGKEPSESCIRRFCGSTFEDIRYGGRNTNLLDISTGFDKSFSAGGFGARVGISGQSKVYHDKAISDYVAASYETNAFFGVKVFSYSVPIFEAGSQSVYSPTEIGESKSRNLFKLLGRVIEKKEETSGGLSFTISRTFGVEKKAEVGVGPFSIDIKVTAGGTGSLTLAVEQIDVLRGIVGSVTPAASAGATARAVTDVGVGRFGVSGELTLIEDRLPVTATFNVGLDLARKLVKPQLNLNISNVLIGPNGRIDLILEVGVSPFTITYSTKLVSFSTGSFTTSIYNKNTIFGEIAY